MSGKRRVYKNRHHINFPNLEHTQRPQAASIRNTGELIPDMDVFIHEDLHANCPAVPVLGYHALARVVREFEPVRGDTFASLDNLLLTIDKASHHPRAHELERNLAQLTIQTLELQRPFIREGIIIPTDQQIRKIIT